MGFLKYGSPSNGELLARVLAFVKAWTASDRVGFTIRERRPNLSTRPSHLLQKADTRFLTRESLHKILFSLA
jgi:hypothetical protein